MHRCSDTSKFNSIRKAQMHQQGGNLKIKSRFCLVKIINLEKLAKFPVTQNEARKTKMVMDGSLHSSVEYHPIMHCTDRPQCASLPVCGITSKGLSLWSDLHPIAVHILPIIIISLLSLARHLTTSKTRAYDKLNPCHALQKAVIEDFSRVGAVLKDHPCYPLT